MGGKTPLAKGWCFHMARNRRCGGEYTDPFIPWQGCGMARQTAACGNTCGTAFQFDQACHFLHGCGYPMTYEEMLNLLAQLRYARLAVCVNGQVYVAPVCFTVRTCTDGPIFTLRVRTDSALMQYLQGDPQVTLQFDRAVNGGVCSVQAYGTAHVTGSTGCAAIIEVCVQSMVGECFRKNPGGCAGTQNNGCPPCGNWNPPCGCTNPCGEVNDQNTPCN